MKKKKQKKILKVIKINKKTIIIIIAIASLIAGIIYTSNINFDKITTSAITIDKLSDNIESIKQGDILNYEINGVNEWKVLHVDIENSSIEVVSNNNTTEIEINTENYQDAEETFKKEAEKYYDNKYVISSRTASKNDLDYFAFEQKFWLSNINEETISYSTGYWKHSYDNSKLYLVPYIRINDTSNNNYTKGEEYSFSINDINDWYVYEDYGNELLLIPKIPIEIEVSSDINIYNYLEQIYNSLNQNGVMDSQNIFNMYNPREVFELYNDYYKEKKEEAYFLYNTDSNTSKKDEYDKFELYCALKYNPKDDRFDWCYNYEYKSAKPLKIGYRPVLTLKVSKQNNNKEINNELNIGDYVKYSANNYDGWKVLSINKEQNEIEIISSGIVKNIELKGKESYDNLETILQDEVDLYKNGDNILGARSVEYKDQTNLNKINDKVSAKYWTNNKQEKNENINSYNTSSPLQLTTKYNASIMSYKEIDENMYTGSRNTIIREWVTLYYGKNNEEYIYTSFQYEGFGFRTYTAGIRPIIKIKLDAVKKLDTSEIKKVEEKTKTINNTLNRKQDNINNNNEKNIENNNIEKIQDNNIENRIMPIEENDNISLDNNISDNKINNYMIIIVLLLFLTNILLILNVLIVILIKKDLSK